MRIPERSFLFAIMVVSLSGIIWQASAADSSSPYPDGNQLLTNCDASLNKSDSMDYFNAGACMGTVQGALGSLIYFRLQLPKYAQVCPPEPHTMQQMRLVVVKYLKNHPEKLHQDDVMLIHSALNMEMLIGTVTKSTITHTPVQPQAMLSLTATTECFGLIPAGLFTDGAGRDCSAAW